MAHGVVLVVAVQVRTQRAGVQAVVLGQPGRQLIGHVAVGRAIDLGPVTGRQDRGFAHRTAERRTQPFQRGLHQIDGHGHAFADRNRRGRVIQTEGKDCYRHEGRTARPSAGKLRTAAGKRRNGRGIQARALRQTASDYTPAGYPQASPRLPRAAATANVSAKQQRRPGPPAIRASRRTISRDFPAGWHKSKKLCIVADFVGLVAQSVEQRIENPCVGGSIPPQATRIPESPPCAGIFALACRVSDGAPGHGMRRCS